MTLAASGSISFSQIAAEIGSTLPITIPSTDTRTLSSVAAGAITIPDNFYGKSWGGGGSGAVDVSLVDDGGIGALPTSVSLGAAETGRLIIVGYINGSENNGSVPTTTTLTLGGNQMTRVSTLFSGLSGDPANDGYNCTFYYLQVDAGTSATLSRSGGTADGSFAVFRMTGQASNTPHDTAGDGTTASPATAIGLTLDIPENGAMVAVAYTAVGGAAGWTGGSEVVNDGSFTAAIREASAAEPGHSVTAHLSASGGFRAIAASWG